VRELTEGDAARAPLARDALNLFGVRHVGADELGSGHVSTPFADVPVGHTTAAWPPAAGVVTGQPRSSDASLHLPAAVAELRLVVRFAALLADDQCGGWNGVYQRPHAKQSTTGIPRLAEYHFEYQTGLKQSQKRGFYDPKLAQFARIRVTFCNS
jgi:hypothetical protein